MSRESNNLNKGPNLYVSNFKNSTVTIYGLEHGKILGTIRNGVDAPGTLAFNGAGQLWLANTQPLVRGRNWFHQGSVSVYNPGSHMPTKVLHKTWLPQAFLFDTAGNAYVANRYVWQGFGTISVYAPGADVPTRKIGDNTNLAYPDALAMDAVGNLYVANWAGGEGQPAQNSVSVFVAASGGFEYAITKGVFWPRAIAISREHLYVANAPVKGVHNLPNGSVTVYNLGSTAPSMTITQGIHTPTALAFDASGNLFVANLNGHSITVYHPNSTTPFRTISNGATSPKAIAIGRAGDLYVANLYQNTISVYARSATKPRITITDGLDRPNSLALQP
jgi:sugar lactone lactonase YvrE